MAWSITPQSMRRVGRPGRLPKPRRYLVDQRVLHVRMGSKAELSSVPAVRLSRNFRLRPKADVNAPDQPWTPGPMERLAGRYARDETVDSTPQMPALHQKRSFLA